MSESKICIKLVVHDLNDPESVICPMIFNLDDMVKLRRLGVCGILAGTLPFAAQQNIFLTIPLKLMVEETIWLVLNGYAELQLIQGPMTSLMTNILETKGDELFKLARDKLLRSFDLQRQYKKEQHALKLQKLGIDPARDNSSANNKLIESSLFVETPNDSLTLQYCHQGKSPIDPTLDSMLLNLLISNYSNWNNYLLYQSLKSQNYVMSPGGRFGGLFIAYPGDPLRYHSHLTIDNALDYYNDPIDFISLTSGARLGTAVKKLWVIGGVKDENSSTNKANDIQLNQPETLLTKRNDTSFFSIEWAGFG
ncbi:tRNA-splicing endonuclease subunit Sen34p [Monosporozyma unispora]|nr:tRNA-splicing endonuclease subunit [Kazachstania unispora]